MRWIVIKWLKAFFFCLGVLFVIYVHVYGILAIASALHKFDHLAKFSQYESEVFIGSVLVSVGVSTWFTLQREKD